MTFPNWLTSPWRRSLCRLLTTACLLLALAPLAEAAPPSLLSHQGYLTSPTGSPISGTLAMRFAIYNVANGGGALWQESQNVAVQSGSFSVVLGSNVALNLPFDTPYYLGISVGNDNEMTPRQRLTSVPYAYTAQSALSVADGSITAAKLGESCASGQVLAYNGTAWACASVGGSSALDANGNLVTSGYVKLGGGAASCNSSTAGTLRWTGSRFEGCDGTSWTAFAVAVVSCSDSLKNGSESDVDCGGSCGKCADAKACNQAADCLSGTCNNGVCAVTASCSDMVKNGSESDVDCGGSCSQKCAVGKTCASSSDCQSSVCGNGMCVAPTCSDAVKNGAETDVDCGGSCGQKCSIGKTCTQAADCQSGTCSNGVCTSSVQCTVAADCAGSDTACSVRTCNSGVCGRNYAASGTIVADQIAGDCHSNVCDGSGNVANMVDDSDLPSDDGNPCTAQLCSNGNPAYIAVTDGTACGNGLTCQAGACQ